MVMKNPMYKRILRAFFHRPWKILPIFLALTFVVIFSSSFFTAQDSIKSLYEKQITEGKVEDGEFTTIAPLSETTKRKLEQEGISLYENFNLELSPTKNKQLKAFKNRTHINIAQILEGKLPSKDDEVAISGHYARANKLVPFDSLKIQGKNLRIVGIISLPDYSTILRNRNDLLMDTGYFGTCLLSDQGFEAFHELPVKYTYSYHTHHELDKKSATDKLNDLIEIANEDHPVIDGVTRFNNKCITYIMDDMGGDVPTMTTVMVILFIALAFISAVEVKSVIEKEAPMIGTLLASGYLKKELIRSYMATPLIVSLLAAIVGNVIAYTIAYRSYAMLYYQSFDLPTFEPILNARSLLLTSIAPFIIYLIINFFVISRCLRLTPLQFLRNNLRSDKKKTRVKLKHLPFMQKFRIRIALSNKLNLATLIFGIFLANILLLFGIIIKPVMLSYADNMSQMTKYQYTYLVKTGEANLDAEKATITKAELVDQNNKSIDLYGIDENSKYPLAHHTSLKKDEIVITRGLVDRYHYKIGDTLRIREPYLQKEVLLKIKDIVTDNNLFQLFTTRENLNHILDKDNNAFNAYLSDDPLEISKDNLITRIDKNLITQFAKHFLKNFDFVFDMVFYTGIAFYIIIVSMITTVILDKSKLHMSYLKIFGFKDHEMVNLYINALFVFLILFQIVMIPVINAILQLILHASMMKFDAYITFQVPIQMYLSAILYSAIIFFVIQLALRFKISKIDMAKELKNIAG